MIDWKQISSRKLCTLHPSELSSLIWSHRGHADSYIDASSEATGHLLRADIHHFDVDVVFQMDSNGKITFYVSHPSKFDKSRIFDHATVSSFLDVVSKGFVTIDEVQVTMEPKWEDIKILQNFIELVNKHKFANSCAIIVRLQSEAKLVESFGSNLAIAIPLRSTEIKPDELWDISEMSITYWPRNKPVILMPDVKLLINHPDLVYFFKEDIKFVFWIVDNDQDLSLVRRWEGNRKVGYISNRPEYILKLLHTAFQSECFL
jgi:hypothetical protein